MPGQGIQAERTRAVGEDQPKRRERAHRILDAASELIQRWGYKKTAVDDIARLAGVAKGTIYLHWKTREDLFVALLLRESLEAAKDLFARIESDPEGMYLSNIVRHSIYVSMTRPLVRAILVRDANVLGELLQSGQEDLRFLTQQKLLAGRQLLEFFRARGALRCDQSVVEQMKIYSAIVMGFITMDQYLPEEWHSTPEETTELLARTVRAALEPTEPVAPEVLRELKAAWEQYIQQYLPLLEERLQRELA